jgi:hypothetical protein
MSEAKRGRRAFEVDVAVEVTAYRRVVVEAASAAAARKSVERAIRRDGWSAAVWQGPGEWKPDWGQARDLRVL